MRPRWQFVREKNLSPPRKFGKTTHLRHDIHAPPRPYHVSNTTATASTETHPTPCYVNPPVRPATPPITLPTSGKPRKTLPREFSPRVTAEFAIFATFWRWKLTWWFLCFRLFVEWRQWDVLGRCVDGFFSLRKERHWYLAWRFSSFIDERSDCGKFGRYMVVFWLRGENRGLLIVTWFVIAEGSNGGFVGRGLSFCDGLLVAESKLGIGKCIWIFRWT